MMALPGVEVEGEVWTADAAVTASALRELLGFDALLLCSLEGHDDPEARVQRAVLLAVPRGAAPLPRGARWVGREDLAAAPGRNEHAAVAARVLDELAGGRVRGGGAPWADRGWFQAAEGWLHATLARLGSTATGPVRQVRVWELSCILRASTARGDVLAARLGGQQPAEPLDQGLVPGRRQRRRGGQAGGGVAVVADLAAHAGRAVGEHHRAQADGGLLMGGPGAGAGEQPHLPLQVEPGDQGVDPRRHGRVRRRGGHWTVRVPRMPTAAWVGMRQ
jgi:hypothetical protein